jgi:hypothetical protein
MKTLFFLFVLAGCSSSSGAAKPQPPPATFTQVYTEVIALRCMPCHTTSSGDGVTFGRLDMTSQTAAYSNLVSTKAAGQACGTKGGTRVTPGEPDASVMYLKISLDDPTPCGEKMPLGGPPLTQAQADLIEGWITAGAKND